MIYRVFDHSIYSPQGTDNLFEAFPDWLTTPAIVMPILFQRRTGDELSKYLILILIVKAVVICLAHQFSILGVIKSRVCLVWQLR